MASADVVVRFIGDTKQLNDDIQKVETSTSKLGDGFKNMARTAVTAIASIEIARFAKDAVNMAADFADQFDAVGVVFGEGAKKVQKWSDTTADALGLAQTDALKAAIALSASGKAMGKQGEDLADFSITLSKRAADVASLFGGPVTEAVEAFTAAMRGETDPIEKYGVFLNEAAIKAEAVRLGLIGIGDPMTDVAKKAATYSLIMSQTAIAQGNFADTADSAANKMKVAKAKIDEAQVALGTALLPIILTITPLIEKFSTAFANAEAPIQNATIALAGFLGVAIATGGTIGLVIAAIGAIIVTMYLLFTEWDKIWGWIKDHPAYAGVIHALEGPFGTIFLLVMALGALWDKWQSIWSRIHDFTDGIANGIEARFDLMVAQIGSIPGRIAEIFSGLGDRILAAVGNLYNVGVQVMEHFYQGVASMAGRILDKVESIAGQIAGKLNPFGSPQTVAYYTGQNVMRDFMTGVQSLAPSAERTLAAIGTRVVPALAGNSNTSTFNINVNVPIGANPAQVGAATVDAIRAYERVNGRAWRNS